jgi:DNA-binding Lrp family transcriptional regulator
LRTSETWVAGLPKTIGVVFVTSGRADFIVHVAVSGNDALYAFVIDRLTSRKAIADVETSIIYEHLRDPVIHLEKPDRSKRPPAAG